MDELRVKYDDRDAIKLISAYLAEHLNFDSVILCIGTDKCIGDSLGPIVGDMLSKMVNGINVYGTLKNPIHAINLEENIAYIKRKHPYSNIIAVDACLGDKDNIGKISIKKSPIYPGKGVGKVLPAVGDISIIGVIDAFDIIPVHNTRLGFVFEMAEVIAMSIHRAFYLKASIINNSDMSQS
ncbi:spore protease YyaC [Thermoanaerobacterium thermosaccharolyticum]|jgi:putative sporulation protein YyaC|uniref:Sporulation protein YyaC n=2 Tax=Thermoanaerobacterium thermosaccharolyticum TaxID=1517 RepID=D9TS07_THETC|nr:spore protease YyaC [Thermoanaerobacterium thermosaccharolyticum]ADL69686.1 sporulation protein YyaC [Thermoanaerobacterium thermosaccharolyticum DSM 571]AST56876.1 sporulation protein [Thermoanaerobacterium thermosaccharolyticum]PHO06135.1 spore protease YyaC [Thermoanaerobacterium thermosaccharolyticum]